MLYNLKKLFKRGFRFSIENPIHFRNSRKSHKGHEPSCKKMPPSPPGFPSLVFLALSALRIASPRRPTTAAADAVRHGPLSPQRTSGRMARDSLWTKQKEFRNCLVGQKCSGPFPQTGHMLHFLADQNKYNIPPQFWCSRGRGGFFVRASQLPTFRFSRTVIYFQRNNPKILNFYSVMDTYYSAVIPT